MACTVNDLNLSFDVDGRLRNVIGRVAQWDVNKAYALGAYLISDEFRTYVQNRITNKDLLNNSAIDFDNFKLSDYAKINKNKLTALLNAYYREHIHSVNNAATSKLFGSTNGFTSGQAKQVALTHVGDTITRIIFEEQESDSTTKMSMNDIIKTVYKRLSQNWYDNYIDTLALDMLNNKKYKAASKAYAKNYFEIVKKLNDLNNTIADNKQQFDSNKARIEELEKAISENAKAYDAMRKTGQVDMLEKHKLASATKNLIKESNELNSINEELEKQITLDENELIEASNNRYLMANNLIGQFGKEIKDINNVLYIHTLNYTNLINQLRGDQKAFYQTILHNANINMLLQDRLRDTTIEDEMIQFDDNDMIANIEEMQTKDEASTHWEDHGYRSFMDAVDGRVKKALSTITQLGQVYDYNATDNTQQIPDTNNELGVSHYMDVTKVISNIQAFARYSNGIDDFIKSIKEKADTVKELYGLGQLVAKMQQDKEYANYLYCAFSKPIVHKTMATIVNNSVEFDYSNPNAFATTKFVLESLESIKYNYFKQFNTNFDEQINSYRKNLNSNKRIEEAKDLIKTILNTYFPNIRNVEIENLFDGSNQNLKKNIISILDDLKTITANVAKLQSSIYNDSLALQKRNSDNYEQWRINRQRAIKQFEAEGRTDFFSYPDFEKESMDYSKYVFSADATKAIVHFVQLIDSYSASKAKLNSNNAEGNSSADIAKNNFITRFFDTIMAGDTESANKGLKTFMEYVNKGEQYKNNPLFFGVHDENGNEIAPGMFKMTPSGPIINPNAKEILSYSLFNGTKNNDSGLGVTYSTMSKADFFISTYLAYQQSVANENNGSRNKNIGNLDSAVYTMRIGSDAPKIFFIRAPKYDNNTVRRAIFGHVMDEVNIMVNALNNVINYDEQSQMFSLRQDTSGLYERTYLDSKGNIVKNGEFVGNNFKFLRLRDIVKGKTKIEYGKDILNAISLYGRADTGATLDIDDSGSVNVNLASTGLIKFNQTTNKFEINTEFDKTKLFNIVNNWCNDVIDETDPQVANYIATLQANGFEYNQAAFANYILNEINMNMNYDDMFEGDFKYYKTPRDFLKRTKESQAGGESYAGFNMSEEDIIKNNKDANGNDNIIHVEGYDDIKDRTGFRAITVRNTKRVSLYGQQIRQIVRNYLKTRKELSAKDKDAIADRIYKGFAGATKVNDAQSYITVEEFIRRRYNDGTLHLYKDLLEELKKDPANFDISKFNARIQVQKNFYFDKHFDKTTREYAPRQIKNAEFVIIPELLPENSDLRQVYDFMKRHGIDQLNTVETSKASNRDIFDIWDETEGTLIENFEDKFQESYKQEYYYKYLYKQQDVANHIGDTKNKLGSQISKKIHDNITSDNEAIHKASEEAIQAVAANVVSSFMDFIDKMGWSYDYANNRIINKEYDTTDANGNPLTEEQIEFNRSNINFDYFYKAAALEAQRSGLDSNFFDYITPDEVGNTRMPMWFNNVSAKLESIAQSQYNSSITRQTMPGWHATQITDIGYSDRLSCDWEHGVMEVYLPRWSKLIPKGYDIAKLEKEGLDIHIGYRMPTEGKQSISILRVKGFVDEAYGSTIVVPEDWVTLTGSDFDVDSVYGINFEMYSTYDENGNVYLKKVESENLDDKLLYRQYIQHKLNESTRNNEELGTAIRAELTDLRNELSNASERLQASEGWEEKYNAREELWDKLPTELTEAIKTIDYYADRIKNGQGRNVVDVRQTFPDVVRTIDKMLIDNLLNKANPDYEGNILTDEEEAIITQYKELTNELIGILEKVDSFEKFNKEAYDSIKDETVLNTIIQYLSDKAVAAGFESFEDFSKKDYVYKLNNKQRNNYILTRFIEIMQDPSSREEQCGRSQFEDITNGDGTGANNIVSDMLGEDDIIRSPYNPFDQLDYMGDVMDGARLKALSVNWDTFISKCNRMKATFSEREAVQVIVPVDERLEESQFDYSSKALKASYGEDVIDYNFDNEQADDKIIKLNLPIKNILSITPANIVDQKAAIKAKYATQFIGGNPGIENSATENYRHQALPYANTGKYNKNDIIFVSIGGKRGNETLRHENQDKVIAETIKAIEDGATIICDNYDYAMSSDYNEGEKKLAITLKEKGYNYAEIEGVGVWKKGKFSKNLIDNSSPVEGQVDKTYIINSDLEPIAKSRLDIMHKYVDIFDNSEMKPMAIPFREIANKNAEVKKDKIFDLLQNELFQQTGNTAFRKFNRGYVTLTQEAYNALNELTAEELYIILTDDRFAEKYDNEFNKTKTEKTVTKEIIDNQRIKYEANTEISGKFKTSESNGVLTTEPMTIKEAYPTFDDFLVEVFENTIDKANKFGSNFSTIIDKSILTEDLKEECPKFYNLAQTFNENNTLNDEHSDFKRKHTNYRKVSLNRIGHSNNNRGMQGALITSYAAQTTAHHLDAVKEGSIPNVNMYTFNVYKMLSAIGLDYETIISFMRQPGITAIVNANINAKSIFNTSDVNAIMEGLLAVDSVTRTDNEGNDAKKGDYKDFWDALKKDKKFITTFDRLFRHAYPNNIASISSFSLKQLLNLKLPLDKELQFARLKAANLKSGFTLTYNEKLAIDIATVIQFNNLLKTANKINNYVLASNADRFGAEVSPRKTRKQVENIEGRGETKYIGNNIRFDDASNSIIVDEDSEQDIKDGLINSEFITSTNSKGTPINLLTRLYNRNINDSPWGFIDAIYQYATKASVRQNRKLFRFEHSDMINAERYIESIIGHQMNDAEYKEYKEYVVAELYKNSPALMHNIFIDNRGRMIVQNEESNSLWSEERSRIFGYDYMINDNIQIQDINNPTDEEFRKFMALSPAQKVLWVKNNMKDDDANIFDSLRVSLFNPNESRSRGVSRQYISFDDQNNNIENMYFMFTNAFHSHNRLIKSAAIDLIKYAFIAEGFKFKSGYITKAIPNEAIWGSWKDGNMDLITDLNEGFNTIAHDIMTEEFAQQYARSHSGQFPSYVINEPTLPSKIKSNKDLTYSDKFYMNRRYDGMIYINSNELNSANNALIRHLRLRDTKTKFINIVSHEVTREDGVPEVRTTKNTLYKVIRMETSKTQKQYKRSADGILTEIEPITINSVNDYYLVPLNKLDSNENCNYSYRSGNNRFNNYKYYTQQIVNVQSMVQRLRQQLVDLKNPNWDKNSSAYKQASSSNYRINMNISTQTKNTLIGTVPKMQNYNRQSNFNTANNQNAIDEMITSDDAMLRGSAIKLVDQVQWRFNQFANSPVVPGFMTFIPNATMGQFIDNNRRIQQVIMDDGTKLNFIITKAFNSIRFRNSLLGALDKTDINGTYGFLAEQIKHFKNIDINRLGYEGMEVYYIEPVKDSLEQSNTERNAVTADIIDPNEYYATTNTISTPDIDTKQVEIVDDTIKAMIDEAYFRSKKHKDINAASFIGILNKSGVSKNNTATMRNNRTLILREAMNYYRKYSIDIINKLNNFEIITNEGGIAYSLAEDEFYKALAENDQYFNEVAELILKGITFGNNFVSIMNIDTNNDFLTEEEQRYVKEISNVIANVKNNNILNTAMDKIFSVYFKKYSTNPMVLQDIISLKETYGDTDALRKLFHDPKEIDNPAVQVILKHISGIFNKAEMFTSKENTKAFNDEWQAILNDAQANGASVDMSKIIDDNEGRLKSDVSPKYYEDKRKLQQDFEVAKQNYINDHSKFREYFKAKLARDKFYANNVNQEVVPEYYQKYVALQEKAIRECGDIYFQYQDIIAQLYWNTPTNESTEEATRRKEELNAKLSTLKDTFDEYGEVKPDPVLVRIQALVQYLDDVRNLNKEYFNRQETEGFKEEYEYYNRVIQDYDRTNPHMSIEEKLKNDEYNRAYNWIRSNGRNSFTKEFYDKLGNAFEKLTGSRSSKSKAVKVILTNAGAMDKFGNIIYEKLTDDLVQQIHDIEQTAESAVYDNGAGEGLLLKSVTVKVPAMKRGSAKEFADMEALLGYKDNTEKYRIIGEINNIIGKAYDKNTNTLRYDLVFDDSIISSAEREKLITLYNELRDLASEQDFKTFSSSKYNKYFHIEQDTVEFRKAMNFYNLHLAPNSIQGRQFRALFMDDTTHGNYYIFGYIMPNAAYTDNKGVYHESYIDEEKTKAIEFINNNIRFTENEDYKRARENAASLPKDEYEAWFQRNHVWDVYNHTYKPISIWTTIDAIPGSEAAENREYIPNGQHMIKSVRNGKDADGNINPAEPDYRNPNYISDGKTYRRGGAYDVNLGLNEYERRLRDHIQNTLLQFGSTTYKGNKFVKQGYLPRERVVNHDTRWGVQQGLNLLGLNAHSNVESDGFKYKVDYANDRDANMNMLQMLKAKGTRELPKRSDYATDDDFLKAYNKVVENNKKIDAELMNKNWREVMKDFVHNATIFNARQSAKPYLYLLLEDIRNNPAYLVKGLWNQTPIKDKKTSTEDNTKYFKTDQNNTLELITNFTRRVLFGEYHENNALRTIANFMQNATSAKYMVFNFYGGIANVTTGLTNIGMETAAQEYFGLKEFTKASKEFMSHIPSIIQAAYGGKVTSETAAFIQHFNVVDYDDMLQFGAGSEGLDEMIKRVRNFTYSFQSGGESYMQNSVLLAMLETNRVFTNSRGQTVIGDFTDYSIEVEQNAMMELLKDNEDLLIAYKNYLETMKYNIKEKFEYISGHRDININFLKQTIKRNKDTYDPENMDEYKVLITKYNEIKKQMYADAEKEFNKLRTVKSLYEFKDGELKLRDDADKVYRGEHDDNWVNPTGDLQHLLGEFKEKIQSVNRHIHGVYNKEGAALIEKEWFGSLLMQYHKHLPMGIAKRWMRKGYYNEIRGKHERGVYSSLIDFLTIEFDNYSGYKNVYKNSHEEDSTAQALASIQAVMKCLINTAKYWKINKASLSTKEAKNIKRILGECTAILSACAITALLYGLYDDDEVNDTGFRASLLYLADRLYAETSMYTPLGAAAEAKTLWSSPIAAENTPADILQFCNLFAKYLSDPDFNVNYTTGQYQGKNKFNVLFQRNIPGKRAYDRIQNITRYNKYYRIGNTNIGMNMAKSLGEAIHD